MEACVSASLTVLLISVGPMTTEAFVPAMREATQTLSFGTVEGSVSLFLGMGAAGHLAHGWLISKAGVLAVALYALCVYAAGSAIVWEGDPSSSFWAGRAMQSVGASGCTVAGFSLLKGFQNVGKAVPRANFARAMVLVAVPMASEEIGNRMGWRACFGALAACGAAGVCLVGAESRNRRTSPPSRCRRGSYSPLRYSLWVGTDALSFASMFLWIAFAPFLVEGEEDGTEEDGFGYWYGCTFLGSAIGSLLATKIPTLSGTIGSQALMAAMAVCAASSSPSSSKEIFVWMALLNCARGVSASHAQAKALSYGPHTPGYAAGVLHSTRMAVTSLAVLWGIFSPTWVLMVGFALAPLLLHSLVAAFSLPPPLAERAESASTQLNAAPSSSASSC